MTFLDNEMMRRCLDLARLGQGKTHPNPMVGAVVLDSEGRVAGEGYHTYYGGPHAEVMALEQAGDRTRGGTLYVSLEPCNHHGKTPPCTSKIVDFDIRRVVCAMLDPNAKVAGQGVQYLKAKRIEVQAGLMEAESREMNRAYCHYIQHNTPYMVLKLAMTMDGKIATRSGQSRWISSASARRWTHWLRSESDAILSTAETVMKDNSRLTVRDAPLLGKPPIRVVLDRRKRLDPKKLGLFFPDDLGGAVWVVTSPGANDAYKQAMAKASARMIEIGEDETGLNLPELLELMGEESVTQLLVEAGGSLSASLLQQRLINRLVLVYGDKLFLDPAAISGFSGSPLFQITDSPKVQLVRSFRLENDTIVEAIPV